jgi:hypothetical protein
MILATRIVQRGLDERRPITEALLWQFRFDGVGEEFSQWGHRLGGGRAKRSRMACLMAGMLGCGGGPPLLFFPSRCFEAAGLEEGVGDHGHQGVSV